MTCQEVREQGSALIDGMLPPEARAAVEGHLAGCAACAEALRRLRATVTLLGAIGPARAPAGFVDRVLAAARPLPWHRRLAARLRVDWPVRLPLGVAAALLMAGLAVQIFRATPELQHAARTEPTPAPPPIATTPEPPAAPAPPAAPPAPPVRRQVSPKPEASVPEPRQVRPAPEDTPRPGELESVGPRRAEVPAAPRATAKDATREAAGASAPLAARAPAGAVRAGDVTGTLAVPDRAAALAALRELATRVGAGAPGAERGDGDGVQIEVRREAWPDFVRGLDAIGRFTPDPEPAELPPVVRVILRLTP